MVEPNQLKEEEILWYIFGAFYCWNVQDERFPVNRRHQDGARAPKVQEHEKVKIPYLRYLNLFESFILYLGQVVKTMKPFCQKYKSCIKSCKMQHWESC